MKLFKQFKEKEQNKGIIMKDYEQINDNCIMLWREKYNIKK